MNELYEFLRIALLFAGVLLVRSLAVVLVLAAFMIPGFAAWGLYKAFKALRKKQLGIEDVGGLELATTLRYAPAHSWLSEASGGLLRMGLDGIAHKILAGVTRVELPAPGTRFEKGQTLATIECGEKRCKIAAPVSGTVTGVNAALAEDPKWILREPYMKGWLFSVRPDGADYQKLPTGNDARTWFRAESHRLSGFFDHELGLAAADGGELVAPPATLLPTDKWNRLTDSFLTQN